MATQKTQGIIELVEKKNATIEDFLIGLSRKNRDATSRCGHMNSAWQAAIKQGDREEVGSLLAPA